MSILDQIVALSPYPRPCQALLDWMGENHAQALAELIELGEMNQVDLTFAAEAMGLNGDLALVCDTLGPLLAHPNPLVREGAIYGLEHHLYDPQVKRLLQEAHARETNETIKGILRNTLRGMS